MLVYVTQGHEKGIGIEIFLKAFSLLSKDKKKLIRYIGYKNSLVQTLKDNQIPNTIIHDLNIIEPETYIFSESLSTLLHALKICTAEDILITQPTTKDQLYFDNIKHLGHTELFRYIYKNQSIPMSFIGPKANALLLSDHLPLKDVPNLSLELIYNRLKIGLHGFLDHQLNIEHVYLSGINPHAGEGGLLGNEDRLIIDLQIKIAKDFPHIKVTGPISGDALHYKASKNSLLVYVYHDQGLSFFKSHSGLLGINTTFGLPFLRLSVDHGTAFDLYGKNIADFTSMIYLFDFVFRK